MLECRIVPPKRSLLFSWMLSAVLVAAAVLASRIIWREWFFFLLWIPGVFSGFFKATLSIGKDGIRLKGFAYERFISYRDIEDVDPVSQGVSLLMRNGEKMTLHLRNRKKLLSTEPAVALQLLFGEIQARRNEFQSSHHALVVPAELRRKHESPKARVEDLKQAFEREVTFREAPLQREDLWRVVENPAARAGDRAASAIALSKTLSENEGPRLRVVAEETADRDLRAAIEAASDPADDEKFEKVLRPFARE